MPTRSFSGRASRTFPRSSSTSAPAARASLSLDSDRTLERRAADPTRSDQSPPLSGSQFDRGHRGCPQHCDFCYKDAFFEGGRSFYTQRVDDALAEISRLPGRHLYFLDDHLLGDRRFAEALFDGMRGMRRLFQGAATVDSILRGD